MCNFLVVLVPVCIGLASGFIVPSGIGEVLKDGNNSIVFDQKHNNSFVVDRKRNIEIEGVLQKSPADEGLTGDVKLDLVKSENDENKLEKYLYEDSNKKDANVHERSFIYIKQKNRKPLRYNIMNELTNTNLNVKNTHSSYLLNRNNIYDEFRRRFSVGYIDGNINNHLTRSKTDGCNSKCKNGFPCKNYNSQNMKKYSDKKDLFIDKFLSNMGCESLAKNVTKMEKVTFKSDAHHYYDKVSPLTFQGHVNNIYSLGKLKGKKNDATDMNLFFPNNAKYAKENYGANNLLDNLLKETSEQELIARKNNARIDHYGFEYCRDCANKAKKPNLSNGLFIDKKCNCKIRNAAMEKSLRH